MLPRIARFSSASVLPRGESTPAPVTAIVDEQGSGRYRARVTFTMAGDWVVRLQGTRADGRAIDLQQDVRSVRPE